MFLRETLTQLMVLTTSHAMSMTLQCSQSDIGVMFSTILTMWKAVAV